MGGVCGLVHNPVIDAVHPPDGPVRGIRGARGHISHEARLCHHPREGPGHDQEWQHQEVPSGTLRRVLM